MSIFTNLHFAGFLLRFFAFAIDTIILCVALFMLQILIGIPLNFGMAGVTPLEPAIFGYNILAVVIVWLYYAFFESSKWQATLGKRFCKIRVTDYKGGRISFLRATGRYFAKYLSTLILFIGYIMIIFTEKKQGLHDMIAQTYVIRD